MERLGLIIVNGKQKYQVWRTFEKPERGLQLYQAEVLSPPEVGSISVQRIKYVMPNNKTPDWHGEGQGGDKRGGRRQDHVHLGI